MGKLIKHIGLCCSTSTGFNLDVSVTTIAHTFLQFIVTGDNRGSNYLDVWNCLLTVHNSHSSPYRYTCIEIKGFILIIGM